MSKEIEIIDLKNDLLRASKLMNDTKVKRQASLKAVKGNFNVFTTLLKEHDEVRLHSRFVTHLLDPKANHDCGRLFLDLFLDTISEGVQPHEDENAVEQKSIEKFRSLKLQKCIRVRKEYGNIDIYIEFENSIIAIENKINAGEQSDQISRYIEFLEATGKSYTMLYLTLDGKKSDTHEKKEYFRISYREHILKWLEKCLQNTYKFVNINQALQQYNTLIKQLTGQTLEIQDMEEIKSMLEKNPSIIKYQDDLIKAIDEIRNDYNNKLFEMLKQKLEDNGYCFNHNTNEITKKGSNGIPFSLLRDTTHADRNRRKMFIGICNKRLNEKQNEALNSKREELKKQASLIQQHYYGKLYNDIWILGYYEFYNKDYFQNTLINILDNEKKLNEEMINQIKRVFDYMERIQSILPECLR